MIRGGPVSEVTGRAVLRRKDLPNHPRFRSNGLNPLGCADGILRPLFFDQESEAVRFVGWAVCSGVFFPQTAAFI